MFKSKREPRIGDFVKLILIREPDRFTSFESVYQFLFELFPVFKNEFFDDDYLHALVREPEPESESEPEPEPKLEPEPEKESEVLPLIVKDPEIPNKLGNTVNEKKVDSLDMTGAKSNQEIGGNKMNVPSFGNLGSINKTPKTVDPPEIQVSNLFGDK